jgi:hypothetical protein
MKCCQKIQLQLKLNWLQVGWLSEPDEPIELACRFVKQLEGGQEPNWGKHVCEVLPNTKKWKFPIIILEIISNMCVIVVSLYCKNCVSNIFLH